MHVSDNIYALMENDFLLFAGFLFIFSIEQL